MYHHSQYVFPGNASKVKRHDMSLCSQGIFTKAVQHLLAPPDLPSTFLPWVSGPGSRPFMDCTQRAALSSGFWLSSTNGRHLRDRRTRRESSGHHPPYSFPVRSPLAVTAFLYFLYEVHSSGGQLPQSYSCRSLQVSPLQVGGGQGHKGQERMLKQIPTVTGPGLLSQPCWFNPDHKFVNSSFLKGSSMILSEGAVSYWELG